MPAPPRARPAPGAEPEAPAGDGEAARQYEIRIVQGASRADVERLTSGETGVRQSTRSSRSGPQTSSLRVLPGKRASIESGRIVQAVDAVFVSRFGWGFGPAIGVERSERPLLARASPSPRPRAARASRWSSRRPSSARESTRPRTPRCRPLRTSLLVREGEWTVVAGGAEPPPRAGKTYGTGARLEDSSVLLRVDRVP